MSVEVREATLSRGTRKVLDRLSAVFPAGKVSGVVGPNGSGKSTLLRAIYGYLPLQDGQIRIDSRDLLEWPPEELARHLGVCPQEAEPSLDFGVEQVLSLRFGGDPSGLSERLKPLSFLGLNGLLDRTLSQLSGGERQRVRLGLALLGQAPWLVLDEPANHLDLATAWSLMRYLTAARRGGVIMALHNLTTAARYCDEILVIERGRGAAQGSPADVLTEDLLREVFRLDAQLVWSEGHPDLRIAGVAAK